MAPSTRAWDDRYLAGILFFNRQDYFEAHEVWEDLWSDCTSPERFFYQGLIQAAVGLHHFRNGNLRGAVKLFRSSKDYMERYPSPYLGLDKNSFWQQMARCFAPLLESSEPDPRLRPDETVLPRIELDPTPSAWPDLANIAGHDA
jgi:predicted metal-dependent hydrolase